MLILVVDDDPQIRKLLKTGLGGYGYEVITAAEGQEALASVAQHSPGMIVLDISLGSQPDGLEVCRKLREWSRTPVIILSVRGEEKTKVLALDAGADDYLTKPFGMEELRARIQAVLRRSATGPSESPNRPIQVGALSVDPASRRVEVEGEEVHLTPTEYEILLLLVANPGKIITHRMILAQVWGPDYGEMSHYVRIYISQIRRKLRENPAANVRYILNEPGIGYRFVDIGS
jgi:two-component system, OmpR family, KDP operon response regulator KdpE